MQKRLLLTGAVLFCASLTTSLPVRAEQNNLKTEVQQQLSVRGVQPKANATIMRHAGLQAQFLAVTQILAQDKHTGLFAQFINVNLPVLAGFKNQTYKAEVAAFLADVNQSADLAPAEREAITAFCQSAVNAQAAIAAVRAPVGQSQDGNNAGKKLSPWTIGGIAAAGAVVVGGAIALALGLKKKSDPTIPADGSRGSDLVSVGGGEPGDQPGGAPVVGPAGPAVDPDGSVAGPVDGPPAPGSVGSHHSDDGDDGDGDLFEMFPFDPDGLYAHVTEKERANAAKERANAAITIQRIFRGVAGRSRYTQLAPLREEKDSEETLESLAARHSRIQGVIERFEDEHIQELANARKEQVEERIKELAAAGADFSEERERIIGLAEQIGQPEGSVSRSASAVSGGGEGPSCEDNLRAGFDPVLQGAAAKANEFSNAVGRAQAIIGEEVVAQVNAKLGAQVQQLKALPRAIELEAELPQEVAAFAAEVLCDDCDDEASVASGDEVSAGSDAKESSRVATFIAAAEEAGHQSEYTRLYDALVRVKEAQKTQLEPDQLRHAINSVTQINKDCEQVVRQYLYDRAQLQPGESAVEYYERLVALEVLADDQGSFGSYGDYVMPEKVQAAYDAALKEDPEFQKRRREFDGAALKVYLKKGAGQLASKQFGPRRSRRSKTVKSDDGLAKVETFEDLNQLAVSVPNFPVEEHNAMIEAFRKMREAKLVEKGTTPKVRDEAAQAHQAVEQAHQAVVRAHQAVEQAIDEAEQALQRAGREGNDVEQALAKVVRTRTEADQAFAVAEEARTEADQAFAVAQEARTEADQAFAVAQEARAEADADDAQTRAAAAQARADDAQARADDAQARADDAQARADDARARADARQLRYAVAQKNRDKAESELLNAQRKCAQAEQAHADAQKAFDPLKQVFKVVQAHVDAEQAYAYAKQAFTAALLERSSQLKQKHAELITQHLERINNDLEAVGLVFDQADRSLVDLEGGATSDLSSGPVGVGVPAGQAAPARSRSRSFDDGTESKKSLVRPLGVSREAEDKDEGLTDEQQAQFARDAREVAQKAAIQKAIGDLTALLEHANSPEQNETIADLLVELQLRALPELSDEATEMQRRVYAAQIRELIDEYPISDRMRSKLSEIESFLLEPADVGRYLRPAFCFWRANVAKNRAQRAAITKFAEARERRELANALSTLRNVAEEGKKQRARAQEEAEQADEALVDSLLERLKSGSADGPAADDDFVIDPSVPPVVAVHNGVETQLYSTVRRSNLPKTAGQLQAELDQKGEAFDAAQRVHERLDKKLNELQNQILESTRAEGEGDSLLAQKKRKELEAMHSRLGEVDGLIGSLQDEQRELSAELSAVQEAARQRQTAALAAAAPAHRSFMPARGDGYGPAPMHSAGSYGQPGFGGGGGGGGGGAEIPPAYGGVAPGRGDAFGYAAMSSAGGYGQPGHTASMRGGMLGASGHAAPGSSYGPAAMSPVGSYGQPVFGGGGAMSCEMPFDGGHAAPGSGYGHSRHPMSSGGSRHRAALGLDISSDREPARRPSDRVVSLDLSGDATASWHFNPMHGSATRGASTPSAPVSVSPAPAPGAVASEDDAGSADL